ncbi:helix-turn-helix domain-containing protein [Streptomonospora litoralis]|uniref:Helix-turn-helix domain protein n=1 Tax=Streptomonospora litoralis TaxID=2498135 RepID=A0A4V0ZKA1_9ACTN|nr:helix-turn-helix transcriptional regulator [Streptomonospora litoralis]QBI56262.1 Helix-turn-helix domain protein [Streptomonospora litoralis]
MSTPRIETFRGRQLRKELHRLREEAGFSTDEVAEKLDWSKAKISRIETGKSRVTPSDVRLLVETYAIKDEREREALVTLAREARRKGWWHNYPGVFASTYVGLEAEATSLRTYETQLVPGLMQTERYMRALIRAAHAEMAVDETEQRVSARKERKELLRQEEPTRLWVILDEAVLRRPVGGPEVMREQLAHLIELSELPQVHLQVLRFEAGAHASMGVSFTILDTPSANNTGVVFVEHLSGHLYLDDEPDYGRYTLAFEHLRAKAGDPDDTVALIERLRSDFQQ